MSRLITTVVVVIVIAGVVLFATGTLHFRNTPAETSVTIDKKELNQKTKDLVGKTEEAGSKVLDKTSEALHKAAKEVRGSSHDEPAATPRATPGGQNSQHPD
jgi:hypothetical protein